jgi:hypothetical protein
MDLPDLARLLRSQAARIADFRVVTDFDAFLDEMVTVVDERAQRGEGL